MGKLISRIPGSRLLMSSLQGLALLTHVESFVKPSDSTSVLEAEHGKLDIKRHSPMQSHGILEEINVSKSYILTSEFRKYTDFLSPFRLLLSAHFKMFTYCFKVNKH